MACKILLTSHVQRYLQERHIITFTYSPAIIRNVELPVGLNTTFKINYNLVILKCILHYS